MNRSTALANPSSSFEAVIRRAARCTCMSALPMAMLNPEWANIKMSLGMSPIVAMCSGGIEYLVEEVARDDSLVGVGMGDIDVVGLGACC